MKPLVRWSVIAGVVVVLLVVALAVGTAARGYEVAHAAVVSLASGGEAIPGDGGAPALFEGLDRPRAADVSAVLSSLRVGWPSQMDFGFSVGSIVAPSRPATLVRVTVGLRGGNRWVVERCEVLNR